MGGGNDDAGDVAGLGAPGDLAALGAGQFDFAALAVRGAKCWIAGSQGTRVFSTPDAGATWAAFATNQCLPLEALCFADDQHGWAVGQLGTILATADGGRSWADAALTEPVLSKAAARFRMAWRWDGEPAVLMSRATDETGAVQPTRSAFLAEKGMQVSYHYHAIQSWQISADNRIRNVYA